MADYLPRAQGELVEWSRHFAQVIGPSPADYGLSSAEAATLCGACERYFAACALAAAPATRTKSAVAEKQSARQAMEQMLRCYARLIRANPAVSAERKLLLKLTPLTPTRTRGSAPSTLPLLRIIKADLLSHVLHVSDPGNPRGRGRPLGVTGVQLFCHVGSEVPADPQEARFERFITRSQYTMQFKPTQAGQSAFYFARWQNATGETGPWSQCVSMKVVG